MKEQSKEMVDIFVDIIRETEKALLVTDGVIETWLPKSQIEIIETYKDNGADIELPEWLAIDKGLV